MRAWVTNSGEQSPFCSDVQSRETSWMQPCGGDGNGLACNFDVEDQGDVRLGK
jgi:hypothetical protein